MIQCSKLIKKVLKQAGVRRNNKTTAKELKLLYPFCAFNFGMVFKHSMNITVLLWCNTLVPFYQSTIPTLLENYFCNLLLAYT